ncbi:MAG: Rrf2 family transcriptional regulator [Termitinemataceae bacterium]|nr:MAG: Rrf2 family transcriptional regulator [Termitinemataceae bacterium]GMO53891.1 MAG: Rrf2 family transcriptional regulator [Termitinemataceae bacterium]
MKISTRGRYGIKLMSDLAEHSNLNCITLSSIAERQNISVRYLEQVAIILRRCGFIRSIKGACGGYALAKRPGEIIVGDLLRKLEGDMLVADPPPAAGETPIASCVRRMVYDELNTRIAEVLDKITLAGLLESQDSTKDMYFI